MKVLLTSLFFVIAYFGFPQNCTSTQFNLKSDLIKSLVRDTIDVEDYYFTINSHILSNVSKIDFNILVDTIEIDSKQRIVFTSTISNSIKYTYFLDYEIGPNNDYEYFTINNETFFTDILYYSKVQSDITFRSTGDIFAYNIPFKGFSYTAVFMKNASNLIAQGYSLFLFYNDIDTQTSQLMLFSRNQVSPDCRCFGYDATKNILTYYEWDFDNLLSDSSKYYDVFEIAINRTRFIERKEIRMQLLNKWSAVFN